MSFRIRPLPTPLAEEARRTGLAPGYGHPVQASVASASGYGPCRHCLRRTREGERRLLLNYNPYPEPEQPSVVGPIFIHAERCEAYAGAGFPEEVRGLPLLLQGHLRDGSSVLTRRCNPQNPEGDIEDLFRDPAIGFITLRNEEAGCFIARIERAPEVL